MYRHFVLQARLVAAATGSLCEAANAAIQGNCSEETLVASCKAVSNSTAQLLLACRARADPNSKTQKGLQVKLISTIKIFCYQIESVISLTNN